MPDPGHRAQRTCLGCRRVVDQGSLLRFVLSPEGEVLVDYGKKLPGRGAYTHFDLDCLRKAVRARQFDRAFRATTRPPEVDVLSVALARQIRERVLNLVGMARKSGQVVSGSGLVLDRLGQGAPPALVLLAADGSAAITEKITLKAGRVEVPCYRLADKDLLGQILGKGERTAVAVNRGPLATALKTELLRLQNVTGES